MLGAEERPLRRGWSEHVPTINRAAVAVDLRRAVFATAAPSDRFTPAFPDHAAVVRWPLDDNAARDHAISDGAGVFTRESRFDERQKRQSTPVLAGATRRRGRARAGRLSVPQCDCHV